MALVVRMARKLRGTDLPLMVVLILLAIYGCVAVSGATFGKIDLRIPPFAWAKQAEFDAVGLIVLCIAASFDYRYLRKIRFWFYGGTTCLLAAVFKMRLVNGAHSWIPLGFLSIQPSEFAKLSLIILTASIMANIDEEEEPRYSMKKTVPIWIILVIPFLLTFKEPALGQALVMFAITMTMYVVFSKKAHFWVLQGALAALVMGAVVVLLKYSTQSTSFIQNVLIQHHILQSYQADRIITWLNPKYDLTHTGYNVHQSEVAVGSGQTFGVGFHRGIEFVPNQWTDYIFSAVGEEFGFIGSSVLVLLFMVLIYRLTRIALSSKDTFGTYIIVGVIGMFGVSAIA